jgi:caa(3)-type oxidase subunit IV
MSAVLSYEQKKKKYINVFYGLIALTVIELIIVALPFKGVIMPILIAVFSSAKAVVVGYYYMHLEHETKMLKIVACLPIIAFGYAFFLVKDIPHRPLSAYENEPARVFPQHGEGQHDPYGVEKAAEEAQAELEASAKVTGDGAKDGTAAKAEAPQAASSAPAGGGSDDDVSNWR